MKYTEKLWGGYSHLLRVLKRVKLGIQYHDFTLISVGEINENKNHRAIIEALHILKDKDIKYFIVGKGELKEGLQKLTEKYNLGAQVFFMGYREDIPQLLKAADVFCFPSKREGLGLSAVEAMASGLPLITSNVHGINDYSVNGVTGYSCAPDDYNAYAQAIKTMKKYPGKLDIYRKFNAECAKKYDIYGVESGMRKLYEEA